MIRSITLRSDKETLTIEADDNLSNFDKFKKWLYEYVSFEEICGEYHLVSSSSELLKCRLKANRLGLL